jgi:hypothetical protein
MGNSRKDLIKTGRYPNLLKRPKQAFKSLETTINPQIRVHGVKYIARRFIVADHRLIK